MEKYGLDLSSFQTNVNFNNIKQAGYSFVILRINTWSKSVKASVKDPKFEEYYRKATEAGLNVGAYWFTYANTVDYAKSEAKTCVQWLKGKRFNYPIYLDLERKEQFEKGKAFCTELVKAFCSEMEKNGFFVGVYCSTYWYTNYVDEKTRERYACWIAEWSSKCKYTGTYGVWQNGTTSCLGVNESKSAVDHNIAYIDYPSIIVKNGFNGYSVKILDDTSFLCLGENSSFAFIFKKILQVAYEKKLTTFAPTNNYTYDKEAQNAVNQILEKWGYKPNGNVGKNFIEMAFDKIIKG